MEKSKQVNSVSEPYIGLRPYTEDHEAMFFGRDAEQAIIIDKVLSEKCTMLFAASGVGKSSLLQAGVIPSLKQSGRHNLNVVYFKDWVVDPLPALKKVIVTTLKIQKAVDNEYSFTEELTLKDFLRVCTTFASEPLIVILDQFEEVFQYQRYTDKFTQFIVEMAEALRDKETTVNFLISMREDFALYMNAFKGHLPTTIFENYYRLEKLNIKKARQVIEWPAEKCNFHYEDGLLDELINDLANQEREGEIGNKSIGNMLSSEYVEAPNVQIVCMQLWELERSNPEKIIRKKTYYENGRASGFTQSYFDSVLRTFSKMELHITSRAFTYLVTPRGTKMAYPVTELSHALHIDKDDLQNVLYKLEVARVLRCQVRDGVVWYELYHDIFSKIINNWNEGFKAKHRNKYVMQVSACSLAVFFFLFFLINSILNITNYHLRLSNKIRSAHVELYKGFTDGIDIVNQKKFIAETPYTKDEIEPDKGFEKRSIRKYKKLNDELIDLLPIADRVSGYMHAGEIGNALVLAKNFLKDNNKDYQNEAISFLSKCHINKPLEILATHINDSSDLLLKTTIIRSMVYARFPGVDDILINLLGEENKELAIESIVALGKRSDKKAVYALVNKFNTQNDIDVRINIAEALAKIGSSNAEDFLLKCLRDKTIQVRMRAIDALGTIRSQMAVGYLIDELNSADPGVRIKAIEALGTIGDKRAVTPIIRLLSVKYPNDNINLAIVNTLGKFKDGSTASALNQVVNNRKFSQQVRLSALNKLLYEFNTDKNLGLLIKILQNKNANNEMTKTAISRLGKFKNENATNFLLRIFYNDKYSIEERKIALKALGNIGGEKVKNKILPATRDKNMNNELKIEALNILVSIASKEDVNTLTNVCEGLIDHFKQITNEKLENVYSAYRMDSVTQTFKKLGLKTQGCKCTLLGRFGSEKVTTPMIGLLLDKYSNDSDRMYASEMLKEFGTEKDVDSLEKELKNERIDIQTRIYIAEVLGALGSDKAIEPLIQMIGHNDDSIRLRAVKALAVTGSEMAVEPLMNLLNDTNDTVRKYTENVLMQINPSSISLYKSKFGKDQKMFVDVANNKDSSESSMGVEQLKLIAIDSTIRMSKRLKAIDALGERKSPYAGRALKEIFINTSQYYHYKVIHALKNSSYSDALSLLRNSLDEESERVALWRKIRDRNTDKFADTNMLKWRDELELYQPQRALLFELSNAICTIDTSGKQGIDLLSHELVAVRAGAYTGLSKHSSPRLIKMLYRFCIKNNNQLFQQCSYRAIDGILLSLEANGEKKEMDELEKIKPSIRDTTGAVYYRLEWTIDKMKERI